MRKEADAIRQPKLLTTLKAYDAAQFRADLIAGATVAMVALPLSLAIAIASGAEPATGLVTAIVAGFLISALGGSRVQVGGPTGAFIVVVSDVIATHGFDGLVMATLMAGVILMIAGYFRAGRLIAYVPEAVVNGFTIGIAVIIATSQIKDALGMQVENMPADFLEKLPVLWEHRDTLSLPALASQLAMPALAALLIIVAWNMSEPHKWGEYMRARRSDQFLLVLTLVLTVVADLTVAIGVGVAIGLALRLNRRKVETDWSTPER
ncbi:C4-dicarboxylic acid transporter DauA [Pseudoruegeria aquimaris]|uniref:C4-dicarboxylic acid transporter DauA n=1 Tax=Pseudoruegeria aquimaris TaxID=393663 RepID=A0A1Y5RHY2_9RHOB|nr:SulP family inorganic anion transporter [Pseudoruegeria aquimaris]SLN17566.1 C4-dicarboxylic acid transporter DauA [Pseudoruegeria aquimaris]